MTRNKFALAFMLLFAVCSFAFTAQIIRTSLRVTVVNELGNAVEGAQIQLFKTAEDYNEEKNAIIEPVLTDKKGNVVIKNLEALPYYISVSKGDMNNFGAGEKTDELKANFLNKITVVISE